MSKDHAAQDGLVTMRGYCRVPLVMAWPGVDRSHRLPDEAGMKFEYKVRMELGVRPKSKRVVSKYGQCVAGMQENSAQQEPQCVGTKSLPKYGRQEEKSCCSRRDFQVTTSAVVVKVQAVAAARSEREARGSDEEIVVVGAMKALRNSAQSRKVHAAGPDPAPGRSAPGRQHPHYPHRCSCQQRRVSTA